MRIGFFTDSYLPRADGVATGVEAYRAGLTKLGHTVYVFCPKRPEPFKEPTKNIYRFRSVPSLSYENYRDTFPFRPKHIKLIKSLNLDLVHTFTQIQIGLLGMYIARREKIPLVTTCMADFELVKEYRRLIPGSLAIMLATAIASRKFMSGSEVKSLFRPANQADGWRSRTIKTAAAFYSNQCEAVTVPSIKVKKAIDKYMKKPSVVIPLGTDLGMIPKNPDTKSIRSKYKIPVNKVAFVSSSRLVKEKRIDFLLNACSKLSENDREKSVLVIVGKGPHENYLKKLVEDLGLGGKVIFTGMLEYSELIKVISACDIHVHASIFETQGLVLNEAAGAGLPIIMIDRWVNPVLQDGRNGFFAADNVLDFSRKMSKLLNDKKLRLKFGKQSKVLAKQTSQEKVSKELESLYKSLT